MDRRQLLKQEGKVECPSCGELYEEKRGLGQHWSGSSCDPPKLTRRQKEILVGILMGDGYIGEGKCEEGGSGNHHMQIRMTNREFLEWVDSEMGVLSSGVRLAASAEQQAHSGGGDVESYSPLYGLTIRTHPYLSVLAEWYSSGKKVMPEDIEMTPMVLKMWYVCDGGLSGREGCRQPRIALNNEKGNKKKVLSWFEESECPVPYWYEEDSGDTTITWTTKEDRRKFFEYIGSPPPGFKYKWV